ncbi:hypothetical protein DRF65_14175 [Chryseobacterium pennae]|uniref:DUF2931 family protein n=1 Tax=Chryseobacterium pennae TaxID=2258962 RepID=A0A3D9C7Z0_9FLAO|nr:DUF2931 family protein [Chryseobacterium pennae]REC61601.1 hypothetical protein DRF65_14175 [Chryseobacterium pennae]
MARITTIKLIFSVMVLLSLLHNCGKEGRIVKHKFPYMVTVTAPKEYPIEVHEGWLLNKDKKLICGMPRSGKENQGWANDGTEAGQGGSEIPTHLNLTYIAYAEKKFYTVDADLPSAKILEGFRKGFSLVEVPNDQNIYTDVKHSTYDRFTVGAAPGGVIVVWLSAGHHRVEICRLQAKEIFIDKDKFRPSPDPDETQEQFFNTFYQVAVKDSVRNDISKNGIPFGLWDKYRTKYKYRFILKPYDGKDKIVFESIRYYNGEAVIYYPQDLSKQDYRVAGLPYNVSISFTKYNTEIFFNDKELMRIFENFKQKYPDKPVDIVLVPTFMYNEIALYVECNGEKIKLEKAKVDKIWGG